MVENNFENTSRAGMNQNPLKLFSAAFVQHKRSNKIEYLMPELSSTVWTLPDHLFLVFYYISQRTERHHCNAIFIFADEKLWFYLHQCGSTDDP